MGGPSPQQARLDANVPAPTVYQVAPTPEAMKDQWKTSSMYINNDKKWQSMTQTPSMTPIEYTPGSTAQGTRRFHFAETTLPYGRSTIPATAKAVWPPQITPVSMSPFLFVLSSVRPCCRCRRHRSHSVRLRACGRAFMTQTHNFKLASYAPQSYAGAHLERRTLVAGLGGIDPTQ